jgi:CRP-like cAMP-binding protein
MTMNDTMTLVEKTVFLSNVDLLKDVPTEALAQLAARAAEARFDRGQTLFAEGDPDHGTFIVVEGLVELRRADAVVRRLQAGSAYGELFLGENERHQSTAIAREDTHVLNLPRADVLDALIEYPEFGLAMVQDLARRHERLTQRVIELEAALERVRPGAAAKPGDQPIEPAEPASRMPRQRGWWRRGKKRPRQDGPPQ